MGWDEAVAIVEQAAVRRGFRVLRRYAGEHDDTLWELRRGTWAHDLAIADDILNDHVGALGNDFAQFIDDMLGSTW